MNAISVFDFRIPESIDKIVASAKQKVSKRSFHLFLPGKSASSKCDSSFDDTGDSSAVSTFVTVNTKSDQILRYVMAQLTPGFQVVDLEQFCGTVVLASPSIAVQDQYFERLVLLHIQF
jgi:hypothetical protein